MDDGSSALHRYLGRLFEESCVGYQETPWRTQVIDGNAKKNG
jgi:hypothetical protein